MEYLHRRKEVDDKAVALLEEKLGYRREVCEALVLRGIDDEDKAQAFLHPFLQNLTPWENYSNMQEVRDRLMQAIECDEKVVIYGDYDCDGVCATAILYLLLSSQNIDVEFYLPNRKREGYGLNKEALEDIAERYCPDLIITVDCGITAVEEIDYAQDELGLEIIVTDHHEPSDILPNCLILDPKIERREDCFNELCGAGIALRICEALGGQGTMMMFVDIATLATIADIVPLVSDNRIIVNYGIDIINSRARQSIKLLMDISCDDPNQIMSVTDVAFKIVPKINAIGRLSDSTKAVKLFIDDDYFYAKSLATQASEINEERKALTNELTREALYKLEDYDLENNRIIVLYNKGWESGVLGIACSKLVEIFRRPVILLSYSDGVYKGSCRSIEGVNLYEALRATSSYMVSFGGHSMACGLVIEEEKIQGFIMALGEYLRNKDSQLFLPNVVYDLEITASDMDVKLVEDMSILEPFGMGNPQVAYLTNFKDVEFQPIGKTRHIKANINEEFEIVAFDGKDKMGALTSCGEKSLVYSCGAGVFRNRKYAQGILTDCLVDYTSATLDADYFAVKHLYQKRYPDKSLFAPKEINDKEIEELLDKGIYGACFLCYNVNTFKKFVAKYGEKLIFVSIGSLNTVNPYNSLVLDIDINEKLNYYRRIVFLDKPISRGIIDLLRLNKDCEVYISNVADKGREENIERVSKSFPSVERMREIFLAMRGIIVKKELVRAGEVWESVSSDKANNINTIEFYIAFFVLFELGIIKFEGKFVLDNTVKTSLDKSVIYSGIRSELGDNKE